MNRFLNYLILTEQAFLRDFLLSILYLYNKPNLHSCADGCRGLAWQAL